MNVATEILNQLGGNKFIAMTGAKNFLSSDSTLSFRLPLRTAKNGINAVQIELNEWDEYTVKFLKVNRDYTVDTIRECEGVQCDNLVDVVESETGLYCSL